MSDMISRRKIARLLAGRIAEGEPISTILKETAAYLVDTGRQKEYELLVRDIEDALVAHGIVIGDVTVAEPTEAAYESVIAKLRPGTKKVHVREHISPDVKGGIKVEIPGERYDATLQTKLDHIRQLTA